MPEELDEPSCPRQRRRELIRWSGNGRKIRQIKEARQGVVGLCRASGIYYKREKKADARL